jgi:predicted rRNA pseudouridine synthase
MLRDPPEERSPADLLAFGVVNLDKPPGPTSHQVADWVKRLVTEWAGADVLDRVAHTGTLDPKVTGSLPMLLGDATRLAQVFDDAVKEYVAVLELQGPAPSDFEAVVAEFEGEILQKPPRKSAVKRQLRTREVHDLTVLEQEQRRALLRVRCDAGTYIRKLCHDIGLALGTGAHMGDLRRTATGHYDDADLVTMEEFVDALAFWVEDGDEGPLREVVKPGEHALRGLPKVVIAPTAAEEVAEGAPVYAPGVLETRPAEIGDTSAEQGAPVACVTPGGAAVCLGQLVGDPDAESGTVVELERVLV